MITITHLIYILTRGGAARAMMSLAGKVAPLGEYRHRVVSLLPPEAEALSIAKEYGIEVLHFDRHEQIVSALEESDIVQIEWWNEPMLDEFLRKDLPAMRLLSWFHVAGDKDPQYITRDIIDFVDIAVATSPKAFDAPAFAKMAPEEKYKKARLIYAGAEFDRVETVQAQPHSGFNIGYIGSVNLFKIHPDFVPMSAAIEVPDVKIMVCGGDQQEYFAQQARQIGCADRFQFKGYVENIAAEIALFDVYGYPLCEDTFASAELNLQEVMYAGIPVVVFPYGGVGSLIVNDFTGLIVHSALEYKEAIEYLYHHPDERARIGRNATEYAKQIFGADRAARNFNKLYHEVIELPKLERAFACPRDGQKEGRPYSLLNFDTQLGQAGVTRFFETLGEEKHKQLFLGSMLPESMEAGIACDTEIANSSPLFKHVGIQTYRNFYSEDLWLNYWSALAQYGNERYEVAAQGFAQLMQTSFPDWRPQWFLLCCLRFLDNVDAIDQILPDLLKKAPTFQPALKFQTEHQSSQQH